MPESRDEAQSRMVRTWQVMPVGFQKDQQLTAILKDMQGLIGSAVNKYRAAPIPLQTMELEARRQAVRALRDWQPGAGQKPSTFVRTRVDQGLFRWVNENQRTARIPEHMVRDIAPMFGAINDLTSRYGREPSTTELSDHMGVSVSHVSKMRKMLRSEKLNDEFGGLQDFKHDPDYERAMLGYYSLTDQEKSVFDYLTGSHGQPQLKPSQIAQRLKIGPSRITAVKTSIGKKLDNYLRG